MPLLVSVSTARQQNLLGGFKVPLFSKAMLDGAVQSDRLVACWLLRTKHLIATAHKKLVAHVKNGLPQSGANDSAKCREKRTHWLQMPILLDNMQDLSIHGSKSSALALLINQSVAVGAS